MASTRRQDAIGASDGSFRAIRPLGLATLAFLLLASTAHAQSVWINPGHDNWTTGANWSPAGVPTATTDVIINNGGEAQVTFAGATARSLTIAGTDATTAGTLSVTSGGTLTTTADSVIGQYGTGIVTVTRSGSDWTHAGNLIIGDRSGSSGTLTVDLGATAELNGTIAGNQAGSTGAVFVDGAGSVLTSVGTLIIGNAGTATLRVSSTGLLSDVNATLGALSGGSGTAVVTGTGSLWQTSGILTLGGAGNGTLTIEASGAVTSATSILGDQAGGVGTVKVSGAGSSWAAGALTVGNAGSGSLTVESGGAITDASAILGAVSGGVGEAKITGSNSSWTTANALILGDAGQGNLTVEGGGTVTDQSAVLGNQLGGSGTAVVTGDGSTWSTTGALVIGNSGSGNLTVQAGGALQDGSASLGRSAGGNGTALVFGTGSSWQTTGELTIGDAGTGQLTVVGAGTVESGSATLGNEASGVGSASVSGAGSTFAIDGDLVVADAGNGSLTVNLGGTATSGDTTLGAAATGVGSILVTDSDSTLTVDGDLTVGDAGIGSLQVFLGGSVTSDDTTLGASAGGSGTVVVSNLGSLLAVDGELTVADAGSGSLTLASSGRATSTSGIIGADTTGVGVVTVTGSGSDWTDSGALTIGGLGQGQLLVTAAGTVESASGVLGDGATGSGSATIDGGGSSWTIANNLTVGNLGSGALQISNQGTVSVGGGTGVVTLAAAAGQSGTLLIGDGSGAGTLNAAEVTGGDGTATVIFNHNESGYTFAPVLAGSLSVRQTGSGTTILASTNSYSGLTSVEAGTLRAGATGALGVNSSATVASGALLDLAGFDQSVASLSDQGTVSLSGATAGTILTVTGNYSGGGTLTLGTAFGNDASKTDKLVVGGDVSGTTALKLTNLGGRGAQTVGDGIEIIAVAGASPADSFTAGRTIVGAWDYRLYQGGTGADAGNGNWYLRSDLSYAAQTYRAYPSTLLAYGRESIGTLRQRNGTGPIGTGNPGSPDGFWVRGAGSWSNVSPSDGSTYDQGLQFGQTGIEGQLPVEVNGVLSAGVMATFGRSTTTVDTLSHGVAGTGQIDTNTYGFGGNLTWRDKSGLYADAVGQVTFYDTALSASDIGDLADSSAVGTAWSLEVGKTFDLSQDWAIVPQAQLIYSQVSIDDWTDRDGVSASGSGDSLVGRTGVRMEYAHAMGGAAVDAMRLNAYIIANLSYALLSDSSVAIAGTSLDQNDNALMGELGLGATLSVSQRASLFGEASYATAASSFGDDDRWSGDVGLRVQW